MSLATSLVVAAGLSATLLPSAPSAAETPRPVASVVNELVFTATLDEFTRIAASRSRDPRLDWSTDLCSAPVVESSGRSFDFSDACRRHDFAYRNLGRIDGGRRWTAAVRGRVDAVFRADMRTDCDPRPPVARAKCRMWAEAFFRAVRIYAGP